MRFVLGFAHCVVLGCAPESASPLPGQPPPTEHADPGADAAGGSDRQTISHSGSEVSTRTSDVSAALSVQLGQPVEYASLLDRLSDPEQNDEVEGRICTTVINGVCVAASPDGLVRRRGPGGIMIAEGRYKDGLQVGHWSFYTSGQLTSDGPFVDGALTGQWTYYADGEVIRISELVNGVPEGKTVTYTDGHVTSTGNYSNYHPVGPWTNYDVHDRVITSGSYDGLGCKIGHWTRTQYPPDPVQERPCSMAESEFSAVFGDDGELTSCQCQVTGEQPWSGNSAAECPSSDCP
mgnify:CR=1 FL=1